MLILLYCNRKCLCHVYINMCTHVYILSIHNALFFMEVKLQKRFLQLHKCTFLIKEIYERIRPVGSQWLRMYGLPKIRKLNVSLRPILYMVGSVQHELAKWLVELLDPVLQSYSGCSVSDSFLFALIIRQPPRCVDTEFLVSFDISSLLTNIPLDESISICTDYLYRCYSRPTPFPEHIFIVLMELDPKSVSFSFNDTTYRQVDGTSMGSLMDPLLANVFVGFLEEQLFNNVHKPYCDVCYVTLACFLSRNEALKSFHCLNGFHSFRTFTMEEEKDNMLPFLNVLVGEGLSSFTTSLYLKPTFTGLYTSWDSFVLKSSKINLVKCLTYRVLMIFSKSRIGAEIKKDHWYLSEKRIPRQRHL